MVSENDVEIQIQEQKENLKDCDGKETLSLYERYKVHLEQCNCSSADPDQFKESIPLTRKYYNVVQFRQ